MVVIVVLGVIAEDVPAKVTFEIAPDGVDVIGVVLCIVVLECVSGADDPIIVRRTDLGGADRMSLDRRRGDCCRCANRP